LLASQKIDFLEERENIVHKIVINYLF